MAFQAERMHVFGFHHVLCWLHEHLSDGGDLDRQALHRVQAIHGASHVRGRASPHCVRLCVCGSVLELVAARRLVLLLARAVQDHVLGRVVHALAIGHQLQRRHAPFCLHCAAVRHNCVQHEDGHLSRRLLSTQERVHARQSQLGVAGRQLGRQLDDDKRRLCAPDTSAHKAALDSLDLHHDHLYL